MNYRLRVENIKEIIDGFYLSRKPLFRFVMNKYQTDYADMYNNKVGSSTQWREKKEKKKKNNKTDNENELFRIIDICPVRDAQSFENDINRCFSEQENTKCIKMSNSNWLYFFMGGNYRLVANNTYMSRLFHATPQSKKELDPVIADLVNWKYVPAKNIGFCFTNCKENVVPNSAISPIEYITLKNDYIISNFCSAESQEDLRLLIKNFADNIKKDEKQYPEWKFDPKFSEVVIMDSDQVKALSGLLEILTILAEASKDIGLKPKYLAEGVTWLMVSSLLRGKLSYVQGELNKAVRNANKTAREMGIVITEVMPTTGTCLTIIPSVNYKIGLIGRDAIFKTIRTKLEEKSCRVLLYGEGGIGKTAVMMWVCNELKEEGKTVAWITCKPNSSLKKDLLAFRSVFELPNNLNDDEACKQIIKELDIRFGNELYLFIDDFPGNSSNDDLDLLNSFKAHVMVTSRVVNNVFPCIKLPDLEMPSAVQLFCEYYVEYREGGVGSINKDTVSKIVQAAYGNTLLIELYAKTADSIGGTLEDFNQLLESDKESDEFKEVIDTEVETIHDRDQKTITIEKSIMRLYKLSALSPKQQRIMRLFTIFTPEREIYHEIRKWADLDKNALNELIKLAWLGKGSSEGGYTIHQIIKDSLVRQMKKQNLKLMIEDYGSLLNNAINTDLYLPRYLPYKKVQERIVLPEDIEKYLEERTKNISIIEENSKEEELLDKLATLYNNLAGVYYIQGNYKLALDHNCKALKIRKRVYRNEHESIAMTYNNMAGIYKELGEYPKAREYSEKAISIAEKVLDCEDPKMATVYNSAAGVYQVLEDFKNAEDYYNKALYILNKSIQNNREKPIEKLERERLDALSIRINIASVFKDQGKFDVALNKYLEIHKTLENEFSNMDAEMAIIFGNIAGAYLGLEEYDNALENNKKALEIRKRTIGEDHPDTAKSYNNIAGVYKLMGDYNKTLENVDKTLECYNMALEHYKKAFTIRKTVFGNEHPHTISTNNSIVEVNRLMGE